MLAHKHYTLNTVGRDFLCGDLHGCLTNLVQLLQTRNFDPSADRLFALGDLVDRGPRNADCLELLREPWFHTVLGNHDLMMAQAVLNGENEDLWLQNGGQWAAFLDFEHLKGLAHLLLGQGSLTATLDTASGPVGLSHAEPPAHFNWDDCQSLSTDPDNWRPSDEPYFTWSRRLVSQRHQFATSGVTATFHGHTPVKHPLRLGNAYFLDTGCVYGRHLTLHCVHDANTPSTTLPLPTELVSLS